jgi:hypothetical protein
LPPKAVFSKEAVFGFCDAEFLNRGYPELQIQWTAASPDLRGVENGYVKTGE